MAKFIIKEEGFLTNNLLKYILEHFINVLNISDSHSVSIEVEMENNKLLILIDELKISFPIISQERIVSLITENVIFNTINTFDDRHRIPILLEPNMPFGIISNNTLRINADITSVSIIMLARLEEWLINKSDKFERFEFEQSISSKYGFIDFPIVDEYVFILRKFIIKNFEFIKFKSLKSKIVPTHDIDQIRIKSDSLLFFKENLRQFFKNKNMWKFLKSFFEFLISLVSIKYDKHFGAIQNLFFVSEKYGYQSEFYFMTANKSRFDNGYDIDNKHLKKVVGKILKNKMIVGLHGGFYTSTSKINYELQKRKLKSTFNLEVVKGRQHYLRFEIDKTIYVLDGSLKYDSTLGYAEREGFRCGTCHAFPFYDITNDKIMNFFERPLIAMDVTLTDYRKLTKEQALGKLTFLNERCKAVGGDFVLLWHNTSITFEQDWFEEVYVVFLKENQNQIAFAN